MAAELTVPRSSFLVRMAEGSRQRCAQARALEPEVSLRRRALDTPLPPRLERSSAGFDVVAEVKLASPSRGMLARVADPGAEVERLARAYAAGGACAVSVLTEPTSFGGSLDHLERAARASGLPVMRKDFLVDPYQVLEARAAGAAGVLLVLRILDEASLAALLAAAAEMQLFVLLEAFDRLELLRARSVLADPPAQGYEALIGVNGRDLATLAVDPARALRLAPLLPQGIRCVAESGITCPAAAASAARAGYALALVGASLVESAAPEALLRSLIRAGRAAREEER